MTKQELLDKANDLPLRGEIYEKLKCCAVNNIPRKITNILEVMKLAAHVEDFTPEADRVHLANGTLKLDGSFTEGDTISTNNFKGQLCIHFTNSKTHTSNKVDSYHEQAIEYAYQNAPNGHK